jgi:UDP-GlcNAc3NAcA epimerase
LKIFTVIGARPQFIKASVVSRLLKEKSPNMRELIVHTGQHFDFEMSGIFFSQLKMDSEVIFLNVNRNSNAVNLANIVLGLSKLVDTQQPDAFLLYGDTISTLAGTLVARDYQIPIYHVEAGLRSGDWTMTEELSRVVTDFSSHVLFCPTANACKNLMKDSVTGDIVFSGDVMLDLFLEAKEKNSRDSRSQSDFLPRGLKYFLCTLHRAELLNNTKALENILNAIMRLNNKIEVIFPIHPRTAAKVSQIMPDFFTKIRHVDPLSYYEMNRMIINAECVITDSGGVQKEAFFAGKRTLTTRTTTEWAETVYQGFNQLVDPLDESALTKAFDEISSSVRWTKKPNLAEFGNGSAAHVIVDRILRDFGNNEN